MEERIGKVLSAVIRNLLAYTVTNGNDQSINFIPFSLQSYDQPCYFVAILYNVYGNGTRSNVIFLFAGIPNAIRRPQLPQGCLQQLNHQQL